MTLLRTEIEPGVVVSTIEIDLRQYGIEWRYETLVYAPDDHPHGWRDERSATRAQALALHAEYVALLRDSSGS